MRTTLLITLLAAAYVAILGLSTVPIIRAAGESGVEGYTDTQKEFARYAITQARFAQPRAGRVYPLEVAKARARACKDFASIA